MLYELDILEVMKLSMQSTILLKKNVMHISPWQNTIDEINYNLSTWSQLQGSMGIERDSEKAS